GVAEPHLLESRHAHDVFQLSIRHLGAAKVHPIVTALIADTYRPPQLHNRLDLPFLPHLHRKPTAGDGTERDEHKQSTEAELEPSEFRHPTTPKRSQDNTSARANHAPKHPAMEQAQ